MEVVTKICKTCKFDKPLSEYYKASPRKHLPNGWTFSECKTCSKARVTSWHNDNHDRVVKNRARAHRNRKLRDIYKINPDDYDKMITVQSGRCAICGTDDPGRGSTFFPVDHDHETGVVRGLLCHGCNLGIAHFSDDPGKLEAAAAYLRG